MNRPAKQKQSAFTIVELLIVIVVVAILATISIVSYKGVQGRARDSIRMSKLQDIAGALELYKLDNGRYPPIDDGGGYETGCGSPTLNWGHCDRMKALSDYLAPYMKIDPVSLSDATQGSYGYYYNSTNEQGYQTYGMYVFLEGSGGQNDGGYYASAYEIGPDPPYCMRTYTGTSARWGWSGNGARCYGGL